MLFWFPPFCFVRGFGRGKAIIQDYDNYIYIYRHLQYAYIIVYIDMHVYIYMYK